MSGSTTVERPQSENNKVVQRDRPSPNPGPLTLFIRRGDCHPSTHPGSPTVVETVKGCREKGCQSETMKRGDSTNTIIIIVLRSNYQ